MKTNKLKKIQVPQSGFKASRFNWSHDVNTTFGWGEVQPTQVKLIQPNSKTVMSTQELIRLAPMPSPTFGRIKYKTYNQFVPISEIFTNYDRMMAQEPVSTAFGTKVPQSLPSIILGRLVSYCAHGARGTLYYAAGNSAADRLSNYVDGNFETTYRSSESVSPSNVYWDAIVANSVLSAYSNAYVNLGIELDTGYRVGLIPAMMYQGSMKDCYIDSQLSTNSHDNPNKPSIIPLANSTLKDLFPVKRSVAFDVDGNSLLDATKREVTLDGADYLVEFSVQYNNEEYFYCLALEFSDFGKRIRKVLQGCGYQIDMSANYAVSLLPLFAQYKAYFEVFGLTLYQGWETTWCSKVLESIDQCFIESISNNYPSNNPLVQDIPNLYNDYGFTNGNAFIRFMLDEVGNEWYTEEPDWIGSHTNHLAVSPKGVDGQQTKFISIDSNGLSLPHLTNYPAATAAGLDPSQEAGSNYFVETGPAENAVLEYINNMQHSQVDAELLKRMYRWTNRNTILGRAIEKLLRAQGLGDYVDSCESYYIGASDSIISISDVISQSATSDAVLGEYGGRGLQYLENRKLVYSNSSAGYWITLATIVPVSGYTQGLDPTLTALRKFELYNPDFDAVGYMMTTKNVVVGNRFVSSIGINSLEGLLGFGFTPMYSNFKVCQNLVNGDFNRHNQRNKYLSFTLDKQLSYNDYDVTKEDYNDSAGTNKVNLKRTNTVTDLASAGNVWRTPTKYPWLGNFSRIFYNMGEIGDIDAQVDNLKGYLLGWDSYNSDNFLAHGIYDVQCYAHMKPIEESYGLGEDTNPTNSVSYTSKA